MRDAIAPYDPSLNTPTTNQEEFAKALFSIGQAIRQEASAQDPDSPGVLTPVEILQVAIAKVPAAAGKVVAAFNDETSLGDDILEVTHILLNQFGVVEGVDG